jgi:type IV fimbrial biogenesis protein FimT
MNIHGNRVPAQRTTRGFTLVEMAVTLVIVAILASLALPSLRTMLASNRIRTGGTDLVSALLLARSEAIKRNAQVAVAPTVAADWTKGWVVAAVATGEQYDRKNALGVDVLVSGGPLQIVYDRNGRLTAAGTTKLELADAQGLAKARCLVIDLSGVPRLGVGSCT